MSRAEQSNGSKISRFLDSNDISRGRITAASTGTAVGHVECSPCWYEFSGLLVCFLGGRALGGIAPLRFEYDVGAAQFGHKRSVPESGTRKLDLHFEQKGVGFR